MKYMIQKITAIVLCIAMVSGLLPAEQLGLGLTIARAESMPAVTPDAYEDALSLADEQLEGGSERSSGGWRYVLIEELNIVVVTGYDGTVMEELTVPELLGGVDVAGIAANALANLKGVKRIGVPTNVIAIGKGALPAGATVLANNGVYAAKWARKNGHAFSSTSEYDFVSDVVDLTGTRSENFNRVSAEEIWLRDLEASQISVGTKFFLLDPDNLYQVSYYEATALTEIKGGFVAVTCVTPDVDDVIYYYAARDEQLMVDYSTLRLAEDAEIDPETEKSLSGSISGELGLKLKLKRDLGNGFELKGSISHTIGWSGSYEIGLFVEESIKIVQTDKVSGTVAFEYSYNKHDKVNSQGERVDQGAQDIKNAIKYAANHGSFHGEKTAEVEIPMGTAVVFSVAGIINGAVSIRATFEASGS